MTKITVYDVDAETYDKEVWIPKKKTTPCDYPDSDGRFHCPFAYSDDDYVSCRDYCGLGVDE